MKCGEMSYVSRKIDNLWGLSEDNNQTHNCWSSFKCCTGFFKSRKVTDVTPPSKRSTPVLTILPVDANRCEIYIMFRERIRFSSKEPTACLI